MKNVESEEDDDLRPEYDFSEMKGGVRGKYVGRCREDPLNEPAELEPSAELMATVAPESPDEERED